MKAIYLPIIDNGMALGRTGWAFSLAAACLSVLRSYSVDMQSISYPYPDGAMNLATDYFLKSDSEEMIVIDTDVRFKPSDLEKLLSHDLPLVFGLYPLKQTGLTFPSLPLPGDSNPFSDDGRSDLREVSASARGFMRVHRSVFEGLIPYVDKCVCAHTGEEQHIFWKNQPGGHSEDFNFCALYREHGGKIMVDKSICCGHEGNAVYPIAGTF